MRNLCNLEFSCDKPEQMCVSFGEVEEGKAEMPSANYIVLKRGCRSLSAFNVY